MPRFTPLDASINAGELSPRLSARTDFQKYGNGLETCENIIPLPEGGGMRRAGSRYVAEIADSSVKGRVMARQFSDEEAHILEFGNQCLRFYFRQGRLTVADTVASITNGTFDSSTTGWTDQSTGGSASIEQQLVYGADEGTYKFPDAPSATFGQFGDGVATRLNIGQRFRNTSAGEVTSARIELSAVSTSFNAVVGIYTESSGSPGTQVGGNSDAVALSSTGEKVFSWSSNAPSLSADTIYWAVVTDSSAAGTGDVTVKTCLNQGIDYGAGGDDTLTSITDLGGVEYRVGIAVGGIAAMALIGDSGQTAVAEQSVSVTADVEHVLTFRIVGISLDYVDLRVGTASGGVDAVDDLRCYTGWHAVSFTPTASTVYVQFRNDRAKSVYVDDVAFLDNTALQITTPYSESQLFSIKSAQSADEAYLFHPSSKVMKLQRRALRSWSLFEVPFSDGPYLDANTDTDKTLTMASGAVAFGISCTASGHSPFASTDIGRSIRITSNTASAEWGWGVIVEFVSSTEVKVDIQRTMPTGARANWRLGAWSDTTGYPGVGAFFEQRLYAAATTDQPQTLWASQTADFENMRPDSFVSSANTVEDDDALDFTLSADDVNRILWLSPGEDTLAIGTAGGEWIPTSQGATLTPSDITVRQQTSHGSADIVPVRIGQVVLFVQKAKRKLREFAFRFETDGYVAADMTRLAQHITRGGLVEIAYQQEPESLLWAVRGDGTLLSMTFRREEDVVAWSRHILGGAFSSGQAVVDSVATIPGFDDTDQVALSGDRDEVWMIVKRTINGATKRYVEVLERDYETGDDEDDVYYADSLITYDGSAATTITGLGHLEGATVKVWADGLPVNDATVSSGQITLGSSASTVQIGLGYSHTMKTLRVEGGNPAGTSVTRMKRANDISAVLLNSHRLKIRRDGKLIKTKDDFRSAGSDAFFTGETVPLKLEGGWERDARFVVSDDLPAPFTLLALVPQLRVHPEP